MMTTDPTPAARARYAAALDGDQAVLRDAIARLDAAAEQTRERRDLASDLRMALRAHEDRGCPAPPDECLYVELARQVLAGEVPSRG